MDSNRPPHNKNLANLIETRVERVTLTRTTCTNSSNECLRTEEDVQRNQRKTVHTFHSHTKRSSETVTNSIDTMKERENVNFTKIERDAAPEKGNQDDENITE